MNSIYPRIRKGFKTGLIRLMFDLVDKRYGVSTTDHTIKDIQFGNTIHLLYRLIKAGIDEA